MSQPTIFMSEALIKLMAAQLVFSMARPLIEAVVGPKLERRLGRSLTRADWDFYWGEVEAKAWAEARGRLLSELRQSLADLQTIHEFVWKEEAESEG